MSEKFGLMGLARQENMYLSGRAVLECGDDTATEVDAEVSRILKECYEEAKKILSDNRTALDEIAKFLIEKETITGKEFMEILSDVRGEKAASSAEEGKELPEKRETAGVEGQTSGEDISSI
jgi:M41 family endopeptidase ftsH